MQSKIKKEGLGALIIFIVCFVFVLIGIYQIIELSKPDKKLFELVKSPQSVTFSRLEVVAKVDATEAISYFGLPDNISKLQTNEQDKVIRKNVAEKIAEKIQSPITALFLNWWAWFWAGIISVPGIIARRFANEFADGLVIKFWMGSRIDNWLNSAEKKT